MKAYKSILRSHSGRLAGPRVNEPEQHPSFLQVEHARVGMPMSGQYHLSQDLASIVESTKKLVGEAAATLRRAEQLRVEYCSPDFKTYLGGNQAPRDFTKLPLCALPNHSYVLAGNPAYSVGESGLPLPAMAVSPSTLIGEPGHERQRRRAVLKRIRGMWKNQDGAMDGVEYQRRERAEWD